MQKHIVWLGAFLFLLACEKKLTGFPDDPATGSITPDGNRLIRTSLTAGQDSMISTWQYDGLGRVFSCNNSQFYDRDPAGRIYKMFYSTRPGSGTYVHYAATSGSNVAYVIGPDMDSTVFEYNSDRRISKTLFYYPLPPLAVRKLQGYTQWFYDARGNVSKKQDYAVNSDGSSSQSIAYLFDYDTAPNPYYFGNPLDYILAWNSGISPNNLVRQVNLYPPSGGPSDTNWISYQYRTDGKPASGDIVAGSQGYKKMKLLFYYK